MGALHARMLDELGYDPDEPRAPALADLDRGAIRVGQIIEARDGGHSVAVARLTSGRLVVVENRCPHDGGRITDGFVDGELLVCSRHNWELTPCADGELRRCKSRE